MYKTPESPVKIPSVKGIKKYTNGYIYYASSQKWDSANKRPIDNRRCIGKLDPDHEGCLIPNKVFYELFPQEAELPEAPKQSDVLSYGSYKVLDQAANACGILCALKKNYPDLWKSILAYTIYMNCDQNSVVQGFDSWFYSHYCGINSPISSQQTSVMFQEIGQDEMAIRQFQADYRKQYMENIPHPGKMVIAFDSTNQNTFSKQIALAEYGKAKVNEGLTDINQAMFVDEMTGINLFFETFYGSLLDKSETPFTLEKAADLGFQNLFMVMDRGYCTKIVVNAINKMCEEQDSQYHGKMEFAVSCPDNLKFVKDLIRDYSDEVVDNELNYIYSESAYGKCFPLQEAFDSEFCLYLFYDPIRAAQEKQDIHAKVQGLMKTALNTVKYSDKLRDRYSKWLIIEPLDKIDPITGRGYRIRPNQEAIQKEISKCGLFVILSNAEMPAEEMLKIIRQRDKSEKCFSRLKDQLDMRKTGCHNQATFEGKNLVAFVALAIRQTYSWLIRDILASKSSMTVASSIGEMEKNQIYRRDDGHWTEKYALTKTQKDIYERVGLTEAEVIQKAAEL